MLCEPAFVPDGPSARAEATSDAWPRFLLERLSHIRCMALSVRAPRGQQLRDATIDVEGSSCVVVALTLDEAHGAGPPAQVRLRLELGEPLDARGACVQVESECAYVRLPLVGDAGDGAGEPEAGLHWRAAVQRCRERSALCDSTLRCRRCGEPVASVGPMVVALPDADATSMVDFAQCCQDIDYDWACIYPPAEDDREHATGRLEGRGPQAGACYMGDHSLLFAAPPPAPQRSWPQRAFLEPPSPEHARGCWAPLCCGRCGTTLGAASR